MSALRGLVCDGGCDRTMIWQQSVKGRFMSQTAQEKEARRQGWQAPDKLGRHLCWSCRRPEGRDQWRKRANLAAGLPADYGRGRCTCGPEDFCSRAGHPGVVPLYPGHSRLKGTEYG